MCSNSSTLIVDTTLTNTVCLLEYGMHLHSVETIKQTEMCLHLISHFSRVLTVGTLSMWECTDHIKGHK